MSVIMNTQSESLFITKLKQTGVRATFYLPDSSVVNYRALQLHR